jgi:lycopene cyclase domain-containing protein
MTYSSFLLLFLALPILLLLAVNRAGSNRRPTSGLRLGAVWAAILALVAAALVYTTPWDNYLVATRVWWYDRRLVTGLTLGWVPIEEYAFFVLQPVLGGLWLAFLARRLAGPPPGADRYRRLRVWLPAAALLVWLGAIGALLAGWSRANYLALVLVWALPPVAAQLAFGADILWRFRRLVAASAISLTIYLALADALAISTGIWTINPQQSLPLLLFGRLPVEEFVFFLLTNTLVTFGIVLLWAEESQGRFDLLRLLRRPDPSHE